MDGEGDGIDLHQLPSSNVEDELLEQVFHSPAVQGDAQLVIPHDVESFLQGGHHSGGEEEVAPLENCVICGCAPIRLYVPDFHLFSKLSSNVIHSPFN